MVIRYSIEILYHFSCGNCKKWWSVADYLLLEGIEESPTLTCPHCGNEGELKKKHEKRNK